MEPTEGTSFDNMAIGPWNMELMPELSRTMTIEQWLMDQNQDQGLMDQNQDQGLMDQYQDQGLMDQNQDQGLMDQNQDQSQLSDLSGAEIALREEQSEVHELKNKAKEKLKNALDKARTALRIEKEKRAHSVQRTVYFKRKCEELEQKCSLEEKLRKKKEEELETFNLIKEENKNLTLQVQQLDHRVQGLAGLKKLNLKQIEELKDQLKRNKTEHEQKKEEFIKMKREAKCLKNEVDQLNICREKLKSIEKIAERQAKENDNCTKQMNADKLKIYQLTQEIATLTKKNKDLVILQKTVQCKQAKQEEYTNSLIMELENQKTEAEKQRNLRLDTEREINNCNALNHQIKHHQELEARERKIAKQELVRVTNSLCKSQNTCARQQIQKEAAITDRNLCAKNLLKAQAKITEMAGTIQQLNAQLHSKDCDFSAKDTELVNITKKYDSVKRKLQAAKAKMEETKQALEVRLASADKQQVLVEKRLSECEKDNRILGEEVVHYDDLVAHLQQKLNNQEAEKIMQEKTLKNNMEEVISLKQHIKDLNHQISLRKVHLVVNTSRRERTREKSKKNLHPCLEMIYDQLRQYQSHRRNQKLQDMKDREAKQMLDQKYNETLQKLQRCQWLNRRLDTKFMASQGLHAAYEENYKNLQEENKKLAEELKKHKLQCRCKTRCTLLPPIPNKSHSEVKSKEQSKSCHMSGHTCLAPVSTKSYCQPAAQTKVCRLPPISNKTIVRGEQICLRRSPL